MQTITKDHKPVEIIIDTKKQITDLRDIIFNANVKLTLSKGAINTVNYAKIDILKKGELAGNVEIYEYIIDVKNKKSKRRFEVDNREFFLAIQEVFTKN